MKQRSKNYLNLTIGLLLLYFLGLTVYGAVETRTALERMNPDVPAQISAGWYGLIALLGAGLVVCIVWALLSKRNQLTFSEVRKKHLSALWMLLAALGGAAGAVCVGIGLIGSMPELKIQLPVHESQPIADASEPSAQSESLNQAPVPDLPPIQSTENLIAQATGVSQISDKQSVSGTVQADQPDQSCLLALDQSALTVDQAVLDKTGDASSPENAVRYGLNAALTAAPGATVNVLGSTIHTSAAGAPAVAVNGLNASATVTSSDLSTDQPESPVLYAGFQGQLKVTSGSQVSQAERSPVFVSRASSSIEAAGTTSSSAGALSPIIRASGSFVGSGMTASAASSVLAQIEPGGDVSLTGSSFSAAAVQSDTGYQAMFVFDNQDSTGKQEPGRLALNSCDWTVVLSSPAAQSAWNFYVDGCSAIINLTSNTIGSIPQAAKVSNGSITLNLQAQTLNGPVAGDAASTIDMTMVEGSVFTGSVNTDNACPRAGLHLDATSAVSLTGDVYLSDFSNGDPTNANIQTNGYHIYLNGEQLL